MPCCRPSRSQTAGLRHHQPTAQPLHQQCNQPQRPHHTDQSCIRPRTWRLPRHTRPQLPLSMLNNLRTHQRPLHTQAKSAQHRHRHLAGRTEAAPAQNQPLELHFHIHAAQHRHLRRLVNTTLTQKARSVRSETASTAGFGMALKGQLGRRNDTRLGRLVGCRRSWHNQTTTLDVQSCAS